MLTLLPIGPAYKLVEIPRCQVGFVYFPSLLIQCQRLLSYLISRMADMPEDSLWRMSLSIDSTTPPLAPPATTSSGVARTISSAPTTTASPPPKLPLVQPLSFTQYTPDQLAGQITLHMESLYRFVFVEQQRLTPTRSITLDQINCVGITSLYQIPAIHWANIFKYWVCVCAMKTSANLVR